MEHDSRPLRRRPVVQTTPQGVQVEIPARTDPASVMLSIVFGVLLWPTAIWFVWLLIVSDGSWVAAPMALTTGLAAAGFTGFAVGQTRRVRSIVMTISGTHLSATTLRARGLGPGQTWSLPVAALRAATIDEDTLCLERTEGETIRIPLPVLGDRSRAAIPSLIDDALSRARARVTPPETASSDSVIPALLAPHIAEARHDGVELEILGSRLPVHPVVSIVPWMFVWAFAVVAFQQMRASGGTWLTILLTLALGIPATGHTGSLLTQVNKASAITLILSGTHLSATPARPLGREATIALPLADLRAVRIDGNSLVFEGIDGAMTVIPLPHLDMATRAAIVEMLDDAIARARPQRGDVPDAIRRIVGAARATTEPSTPS